VSQTHRRPSSHTGFAAWEQSRCDRDRWERVANAVLSAVLLAAWVIAVARVVARAP
jgi:hypothetical protein